MMWLKQTLTYKIPLWAACLAALVLGGIITSYCFGFSKFQCFALAIITFIIIQAAGSLIVGLIENTELIIITRIGITIAFFIVLIAVLGLIWMSTTLFAQWLEFIRKENILQEIDWSSTAAFIVAVLSLPAGIALWLSQDSTKKALELYFATQGNTTEDLSLQYQEQIKSINTGTDAADSSKAGNIDGTGSV